MDVQLGRHSFPLTNTLEDKVRRDLYFKHGTGTLLPHEQAILTSIGIDTKLESTLKPYLSEFFEKLPLCQTDTSLVLNKECEVPHYVVWSALFDSHKRAKDTLLQNRKTFTPQMDITDAMDVALISNMKAKVDPDADIKTLFTLILERKQMAPVTDAYHSLFTLLLRNSA